MWTDETRLVDSDDEDIKTVSHGKTGAKRELYPLSLDDKGNPLLPNMEKTPSLPELKDIIRAMVTVAYSK
jgi:hypothetical protein